MTRIQELDKRVDAGSANKRRKSMGYGKGYPKGPVKKVKKKAVKKTKK